MNVAVGIDLVCAERIQESMREHGERYLHRVYTAAELADCDGDPLRLAARFAAKEATMKVLRRGDEALPWNSIGVRRDGAGRPSIELTGAAAELAEARGVGSLELSLTHDGGYAAAVVLAISQ
jgi:holo-[acyl-carrier protein] synthase